MFKNLKSLLASMLREVADKIDAGNYECDDESIELSIDILNKLNTQKMMSKYEACLYLNMSRSTFDSNVKQGVIPKGKKRLGFKEIYWLKSDLDKVLVNLYKLNIK